MLYITTRSAQDAFTAHRTIHQHRGSDGGFFVPMRLPVLTQSEILSLYKKSQGENIAEILNLFFGTKLSGWDVDVAVGRRVFSVKDAGHRTLMIELWHNSDGDFRRIIGALAERVSMEPDLLTDWVEIGVRIAVLFGVFGELLKESKISKEKPVDVSVAAGSFAMPMALWYARAMGLPIRNIICGCNENGAAWDLLHRGEIDPSGVTVKTTTPEADFAYPPGIERLIHATLGHEEALLFWWCCTEGRTYNLSEMNRAELTKGMFAAVVSKNRIETIIPSVYRTNQYVLDPYSALAYGALADFRSRTGSFGSALVIAEKSPLQNTSMVASSMHVSPEELKKILSGNQ